jgi:AraC-like DNA-binding protein
MALNDDFDSDQAIGREQATNSEETTDFEAWRVSLRSHCGRYSAECDEQEAFAGSVRCLNIWGCAAVDLSCNAHRIERTNRDVRLDSMEHYGTEDYYVVIQVSGRSTLLQNDRVLDLAVGDIALVDSSRPVTYFSENRPSRWFGLKLPRQSLIANLGLEPEGGSRSRGETLAGRLFFRLIQDAADEVDSSSASTDPYMQLAIYDLVGALFAAPDVPAMSSSTDKLFKRICNIIKDRFADPDFGPCEAAAEAGISLRYLQKLFTARSSACTHFIHAVRLNHAARQLHRRALLNTDQPISQIAYASGFNNYTHFARLFRRRFGHTPVAHGADHD